MPRVLVLFYSRTGHTATLADAVADGARGVRFTEVDVRRLEDLAPDTTVEADAAWRASRARLRERYRPFDDVDRLADYDGLVLGSPARHGVMAAELGLLLERAEPLRKRGALVDRVGAAFTSGSAPHGGHETTLWSLMPPMAAMGMLLVPPGCTDPGYAETVGGEDATTAARRLGQRVATVAGWVRHAKGHEAEAAGHHHHH
jgi:NAD(P)H dehydrogenase (quinone)